MLTAPYLSRAWRPEGLDRRLLLYLAPQAFPLALAIGLTLATVFASGGRAFSGRVTVWLVAVGVVASVVSFIDLAWITPAANQAFRMAVFGNRALVRGAPEMTLGELWQVASPDATFAYHFHTRWALALSPLVLVVFAAWLPNVVLVVIAVALRRGRLRPPTAAISVSGNQPPSS